MSRNKFDMNDVSFQTSGKGGGLGSVLLSAVGIITLFCTVFFGVTFYKNQTSAGPVVKREHAYFAGELVPKARDYAKPTGLRNFGGMVGPSLPLAFNQTANGFDAYDSELFERCLKSADDAAANDTLIKGVARLNARSAHKFLACSMRTQKRRFCSSKYRSRLATRLVEYLKFKETAIRTEEKLMSSNAAKMFALIDEGSKKNKNGGIRKGRRLKPGLDGDLASMIGELSVNGLLSESDFGNMLFRNIPEEIKPHLKPARQQVCT